MVRDIVNKSYDFVMWVFVLECLVLLVKNECVIGFLTPHLHQLKSIERAIMTRKSEYLRSES